MAPHCLLTALLLALFGCSDFPVFVRSALGQIPPSIVVDVTISIRVSVATRPFMRQRPVASL
jgi:hypothetical protein